MTRYWITENQNTPYEIAGDGHTWIFTKRAVIQSSTHAIDAGNAQDTTIVLDGSAYGGTATGNAAIFSNAQGLDLTIGASGIAIGIYGVTTRGDADITNNGQIVGRSYGVDILGTSSVIHNNGIVRSGYLGISFIGNDNRLINGANGEIDATYAGVTIISANGGTSRIVNHGLIEADTYGIQTFDGNDIVINDGVIRGPIVLGKGKDVFDTRGGRIDGDLSGGVGDDVLITDNASYKLVEIAGQGEDMVKSTVSYKLSATTAVEYLTLIGRADIDGTGSSNGDILRGNKGDNVLTGLQGIDTLEGFAGRDTLKGGADADRFIFNTGYGDDKIWDFQQGTDEIQIGGWKAINNFSDVKSHAHDVGGSVVIEAGHDSLTIRGVQKHQLHASDFDFSV